MAQIAAQAQAMKNEEEIYSTSIEQYCQRPQRQISVEGGHC
jgi:hypothetical protein